MQVCPKCQTKNAGKAAFCESCGTSLAELNALDDQLEGMLLKEARKGAWALGIVAVIQGAMALILAADNWVLWAIAGVFAALALWALRAPFIASAVGLVIFVSLHALEAVADPSTIYKGIIMKVVVVSLLVSAIRGGLKHREFRRERGVA